MVVVFDPDLLIINSRLLSCVQGTDSKYGNHIMHSLLGGVPDPYYLYPFNIIQLVKLF